MLSRIQSSVHASSGALRSPLPAVDVSGLLSEDRDDRMAVACELGRACEEIGFVVLTGHGVSAKIRGDMSAVTRAFFDSPEADKRAMITGEGGYRGYIPLASEALARSLELDTAPDLYEAYTMGRPETPDDPYHRRHAADFFAPNGWPKSPAGMATAWIAYYQALSSLAAHLMQGFALALDLPETFFDDKIDRAISNLRAINYPEQINPPGRNQLRCGAHTDYGSLTIVYPDNAEGGLQVFDKTRTWVDVPFVPDAFVMNIGDLLAEWTNDRWVSTLHRVTNPPRETAHTARRQSIAFFHQPNYDAVIACLPSCVDAETPAKYAPVESGEHLRRKAARHAA
ncbi:MAG: isopenicillin N synthase family oxygenase [Hyphomicrobiales bacterium]|nr:isopenicillin N synthase family oxygenase [Hyphomicrobiales bacterium]